MNGLYLGNLGKKIIFIIALLLFVAIASFIFVLYSSTKKEVFISDSISNGSPISQLTDSERYNIGRAAFTNDIDQSFVTLKNLAGDETADPYYRAKAIAYITGRYLRLSEKNVIEKLFVGDPWKQFLEETDPAKPKQDRFDLAARKAFEWSYDVYPTSVANNRIAWWYVRQLRDNPNLTEEQRQEYVIIVKKRISDSDIILEDEMKKGLGLTELQTIYVLDGIISGLGVFLETGEETYKNRAIQATQKALDIDSSSGFAIFRLANFLRLAEGETERSKIESLLDQLIIYYQADPRRLNVYYFFWKEINHPTYHAHRQHIIDTAQFYSPFRNLLIDLSWPTNTL